MSLKMTMSTDGVAKIERMLKDLGGQANGIASKGLYDGAGSMTESVRDGAQGIKTEKFHYTVFGQRMPSPEEKAIVTGAKGVGVARFKRGDGTVNTSVGYSNAGYAMLNGKRKPIPLIANAINSGTSFMKPQAFFRKAVNRGKKSAENAIIKTIEAEIDKMTGGNKA